MPPVFLIDLSTFREYEAYECAGNVLGPEKVTELVAYVGFL